MKQAVIKDGVVVNVIVAPEGHAIPGHILIPTDDAGPGWLYDAGTGILAPAETRLTRDGLLAIAAELRWRREIAGVRWFDLPVATDRDSQAKIMAERLAILSGIRSDGERFKFADGVFRPLTNDDLISLAVAVRTHVQQAFAIEGQLISEIDDGSIATAEQLEQRFADEAAARG